MSEQHQRLLFPKGEAASILLPLFLSFLFHPQNKPKAISQSAVSLSGERNVNKYTYLAFPGLKLCTVLLST